MYDKANFEAINNFLEQVKWDDIFQYRFDVESCWNIFRRCMSDVTRAFVQISTEWRSRRRLRKISNRIKHLYKSKLFFWKIWRRTKEHKDKIKYIEFSKLCTEAAKREQYNIEKDLVSSGNVGGFCKYINNKLSVHSTIIGIETSDGTIATNPTKVSNIFNDYFATVFTKDDGKKPTTGAAVSSSPRRCHFHS